MRVGIELITRNWTLKLAALGLAVLLWSVTEAETPTRVSISDVPVEVALRDPDWVLARPPAPTRVSIRFAGPIQELLPLIGENPRVVVPVDAVTDSVEVLRLRTDWVRLQGDPDRASIEEIRPATVRLSFERVVSRDVPVAVRTTGRLPEDHRRTGPIRATPPAIRVRGRLSRVAPLDSIPLLPVALDGLRDTVQLRGVVDTAGLAGLDIQTTRVRLTVPIGPVSPDTMRADTILRTAGGSATAAGETGA